jgi:hypothetical protein
MVQTELEGEVERREKKKKRTGVKQRGAKVDELRTQKDGRPAANGKRGARVDEEGDIEEAAAEAVSV